MKNEKRKIVRVHFILFSFFIPFSLFFFLFSFFSCTFDYGEDDSSSDDLPNLIMENVDYVRVRSADPLARIQAERVERYDKKSLMKLQNLSFEQYGEHGEEVNVHGRAGNATVEIDTGDIYMENGVRLDIKTEDIMMETHRFEWKDEPRLVSTGEDNEVYIYRENGTRFTGVGLQANTRMRTWEFIRGVRGTYIHNDKDTEEFQDEN